MEDEGGREREPGDDRLHQREKSSFVIKIPSYQEVLETSQSQTAPPSLFTPSPSFSQAFKFIKNSEFYSPPPTAPPPSASATSSQAPHPSNATSSSSRQLDNSEIPSSSSAVASSSLPSQTAHNRNAILVSHRQKGNPLLKHIRNVRWVFADVVSDYLLGQSTCALYLRFEYLHLLSHSSFSIQFP
ncbi:hypothetical protein U1Q18_050533 [Sarracenia purpurea var. burkii]